MTTARKAKARNRSAGRAVAGKTPKTPVIALRLSRELRENIDAWAGMQKSKPGSAEAVRRLVLVGLKTERSKRPIGRTAAAKASKLAHEALDRLGDTSATADERESRKQRLLKGPKEFRRE